ncbi:MAG: hypothetical protein D5S00_09320 [Tindallia sp. MSAO_Bac2]|nr:MAG: hypothetical protein D5S00_09320 [Tindallia sp. MSAO_Bac2]
MAQVITRMIPMVIFIIMGWLFRRHQIFTEKGMKELKNFMMTYALPAMIFMSFVNMEMQPGYFLLFGSVFIMSTTFLLIGKGLNQFPVFRHPLTPYVTSGNSYAFIGIPIFNAVYGIENLGRYTMLGVGQELFLWMVLFAQMKIGLGDEASDGRQLLKLFKTPTIISMFLGILFNQTGFLDTIHHYAVLEGFYLAIEYMAGITTPLIMIMIGYSITFSPTYMKGNMKLLVLRISVVFGIGYLFKILLINRIIAPDPVFNYAFFTFLLMPPSMMFPILASAYGSREVGEQASDFTVIHTIISIAAFMIISVFLF